MSSEIHYSLEYSTKGAFARQKDSTKIVRPSHQCSSSSRGDEWAITVKDIGIFSWLKYGLKCFIG